MLCDIPQHKDTSTYHSKRNQIVIISIPYHTLFHPSRPILDRLRNVRRLDALAPRQVCDGPRQLQYAVIRPRAQVHRPAAAWPRRALRRGGRSRPPGSGRAPGRALAPALRFGASAGVSALVVRLAVGAGFTPSRADVVPVGKPAPTAKRAVCRARAASTHARIAADGSPRRSLSMRSTRASGTGRGALPYPPQMARAGLTEVMGRYLPRVRASPAPRQTHGPSARYVRSQDRGGS